MWSLEKWINETVATYAAEDWHGVLDDQSLAERLRFGCPGGLIPIASSSRGELVFLNSYEAIDGFGITVFVGSDCEFYDYRMGFAEWLFRYLVGEDVMGPNSTAFNPGPLVIEDLPSSLGGRATRRFGPDRGM